MKGKLHRIKLIWKLLTQLELFRELLPQNTTSFVIIINDLYCLEILHVRSVSRNRVDMQSIWLLSDLFLQIKYAIVE